MRTFRPLRTAAERRAGVTTPAVAVALIVAMAGLALLLDRIWLETAQWELTTAAEATALAAARQLASDDRLLPDDDPEQRLQAARDAAETVSQENFVAGEPPSFSASQADLVFGDYVRDSDGSIALDPDVPDPHTVRITLHRTRARNNPVALFIGQLTGVPFGDVRRQADASIDNHIAGIRPVSGGTAPGLPLAVRKVDPSGQRQDTWDVQIEQRRGQDRFRWDADSHQVLGGGDGIPELVVQSLPRGGRPETSHLQILDLGTGFDDEQLDRQIRSGWSADDLQDYDGWLPAGSEFIVTSSPELLLSERDALESRLGEPRICLLFTTAVPTQNPSLLQTTCVELVAVRMMALEDQPDGSCRVVLQPTVLASRSAVAANGVAQPPEHRPNKYIYNLRLTN